MKKLLLLLFVMVFGSVFMNNADAQMTTAKVGDQKIHSSLNERYGLTNGETQAEMRATLIAKINKVQKDANHDQLNGTYIYIKKETLYRDAKHTSFHFDYTVIYKSGKTHLMKLYYDEDETRGTAVVDYRKKTRNIYAVNND